MWPFRSKDDKDAEIAKLRAEVEDLNDSYMSIAQHRATAEAAMHKMQKAMTDEGLDAIAKEATAQIADIYAGHRGGVKARDAEVYGVVHEVVREATLGEKHWNTGRIAYEAYREDA